MRAWSIPLLLALTGCSYSSPSEPNLVDQRLAPPAVNVTGTWTGRYEETSCFSATCQPCCSMRFKGGPWRRDFRLTAMQESAEVTGRFEELPREDVAALSGVVSGFVSGVRLKLRGKLGASIDSEDPILSELRDFDAAVDAAGTQANGTFALVDKQDDGGDFMRRECRIIRLERARP